MWIIIPKLLSNTLSGLLTWTLVLVCFVGCLNTVNKKSLGRLFKQSEMISSDDTLLNAGYRKS